VATGSAKAPEFGCSNIPSTISSQRFCQTTMKEKVLLQQQQQDEETEKPVNFPPRKRSIPYGFDFDLDEVWAPLNPHLRGFRTEASASSSASSSDNSIHSRSILPAVMQSSSVLGGPESRAATARLSERGQKKLQNQDSDEFAVENEDIFMQINSLNLDDDSTSVEVSKEEDVVISTVDLPSAKTLRGGTNIVAKGRHGIKSETSLVSRSAVSSYSTSSSRLLEGSVLPPPSTSSSYSNSSSRLSSGSVVGTISPARSPAMLRRLPNNSGLTPGLVNEQRNLKKTNSTSPRKTSPSGQFKF